MIRINKKEVARRLLKIIDDDFNGVYLQFANKSGVKPPTLEKYINAISVPGGENLARMADAANVSTDWILLGTSPGKAESPAEPQSHVWIFSEQDFTEIFHHLLKIQEVLERAQPGKGAPSPVVSKSQKEIQKLLQKLKELRNIAD